MSLPPISRLSFFFSFLPPFCPISRYFCDGIKTDRAWGNRDKVKIFGKLKINGTLEVHGDLEVWGKLTINGYL